MDRNVVLVVLDSVRADAFRQYATRLQERADRRYVGCRAASSWSTPSHAAMVTGQLPTDCGVHAHNVDMGSLDTAGTVMGRLADHRTLGVSTNVFAGAAYGFDEHFDTFTSFSRHSRYPHAMDVDAFLQHGERDGVGRYVDFLREVAGHDHPIQSVLDGAGIKLLDAIEPTPLPRPWDYGASTIRSESVRQIEAGEEPFFLFTNFMEAHTPHQHVRGFDGELHDVPNDWTSASVDLWDLNTADDRGQYDEYLDRFRALYDASVEYLDRAIDGFLDDLAAATDRPTSVVVTADHGENLAYPAEDGLLGHSSSLSEGLLHVPLLVFETAAEAGESGDTDAGDEGTESWGNDSGDSAGDPADAAAADGRAADAVVEGLVSHLALPDLIVGLAEGRVPDLRRDRIVAERVGLGLVDDLPEFEYWDRMLRAAYRDDEKYVWDSLGTVRRSSLADAGPSDERQEPGEPPLPAWATEPFAAPIEDAKARAREDASSRDVDAGTQDRLRDLGYL